MNAGRFDEYNSLNITAGATVTLISIPVPGNLRAIVTAFANYVGQTAALGSITWRVLVNGIARSPLEDVADVLGDQAQPWPVEDDRLVANGGSILAVEATNSGGVTYSVGARIVGRYER